MHPVDPALTGDRGAETLLTFPLNSYQNQQGGTMTQKPKVAFLTTSLQWNKITPDTDITSKITTDPKKNVVGFETKSLICRFFMVAVALGLLSRSA